MKSHKVAVAHAKCSAIRQSKSKRFKRLLMKSFSYAANIHRLHSYELFTALSPIPSAARARDVHRFAVLGNGAASDGDAFLRQLFDDRIIGKRLCFVFVIDDFLELDSHTVPSNFFTVGARCTAHEKSL